MCIHNPPDTPGLGAQTFAHALKRLARYQQVSVDALAVEDAITGGDGLAPNVLLRRVVADLHLPPPVWLARPDPSDIPALVYSAEHGWGVLSGYNAQRQWVLEWWHHDQHNWLEVEEESVSGYLAYALKMGRRDRQDDDVYALIKSELLRHKPRLLSALVAGATINIAALATAFYTMQVYDRVVPTGARETLLVLTLGVLGAICYELLAKVARTKLYNQLIDDVDRKLARTVYLRFLNVRLDQLPQSVGDLAAKMRGYETVRSFLASVASRLLVDAPFAILFIAVIYGIAGWLAAIPLGFLVLTVGIGLFFRGRIEALASGVTAAQNFKTGLLVESIEGAETIKSGQGGWRMLSRWLATTDEARGYETRLRDVSEHSQTLTAALQQTSYILIIASGAILIGQGEITMGALIACSILSGRVLTPAAGIPSILVHWGHSRAAMRSMSALWALEDDHEGAPEPVVLDSIRGSYELDSVIVNYGNNPALLIPALKIRGGEKIAVLGPVGAGKSTLLRILSGMYKPQAGRILLDDVDIAHISKPVLANQMAFVQQEARLFAGSLRENLILGLMDPGDETILDAARATGLLETVVLPHSMGLQRPIHEGGAGLSGGQRQLVTLTRAFLRQAAVWLLDEPTASMDPALELKVTRALAHKIGQRDTLVLVTHKEAMLKLVERVVVISNHQIVMDGPRDEVVENLAAGRAE